MRPAGRPGITTAAFALAVLFAQLSGLTHGALAMHARCEHGEFVEVDEDDLLPPWPGPREAGVTAATAEFRLSGNHRHCLAQADTPATLALRPPALQLDTPSEALPSAPEHRTIAAGRDRYRLVPKQSPPA